MVKAAADKRLFRSGYKAYSVNTSHVPSRQTVTGFPLRRLLQCSQDCGSHNRRKPEFMSIFEIGYNARRRSFKPHRTNGTSTLPYHMRFFSGYTLRTDKRAKRSAAIWTGPPLFNPRQLGDAFFTEKLSRHVTRHTTRLPQKLKYAIRNVMKHRN